MMQLHDPWGDLVYVKDGTIVSCSAKYDGAYISLPGDYREITLYNGKGLVIADTPDNMTQVLKDLSQ